MFRPDFIRIHVFTFHQIIITATIIQHIMQKFV